MDFDAFEALSFDCYGTLIDWERGIVRSLSPILLGHNVSPPSDEELLELFGRFEAEAEAGAFRPYRNVLKDVAVALCRDLGVEITRREAKDFAASVSLWPPFPDSAEALRTLSSRYRLAVASNVDDDLFAGSAAQLGVGFEEVVTAQQVRSYKPAHAHFHALLDRLGLPRERLLHVAQSLYHDVAPARELGITCVWVNRRAGMQGPGATIHSGAIPDLEVPDLAALVELMAF